MNTHTLYSVWVWVGVCAFLFLSCLYVFLHIYIYIFLFSDQSSPSLPLPLHPHTHRHTPHTPHPHTTTTTSTRAPLFLRAPSFVVALAVSMSDGGRAGDSSAAQRRRGRRLTAAWRHEQLSVRMALAAAQHHSAPKCAGPETHEALQGQTTARAAGKRPAPLAEVSGPQKAAVTVGYVAAAVPVGSPLLLQGGDGVDGRTIRYLLKVNLARTKKEEEKERRRRELEQAMKEEEEYEEWQLQLAKAAQAAQQLSAERSGPDEEEEKDEKEEAPEDFFWSSSSPRLATFLCSSATSSSSPLCSLCSSSTCGHSCCAAETGTHRATFSVLVQFWLVMLVTMHLGCVPLGCRRPRSSASWSVWTGRTVAVACTRPVLLVTIHFALCSFPWLAGP